MASNKGKRQPARPRRKGILAAAMGEVSLIPDRRQVQPVLLHLAGFLLVFLAATLLRQVSLRPDPILQGYLQITTGLFAFVFAAVALVRFQGTQDRLSLILGSGFLLSGATLTASSILFFQLIHQTEVWILWAPVAWWISRILLALLFVVALLVEHFLPRSRHPKLEIAGALFTVSGPDISHPCGTEEIAPGNLASAGLADSQPFAPIAGDLSSLWPCSVTGGESICWIRPLTGRFMLLCG